MPVIIQLVSGGWWILPQLLLSILFIIFIDVVSMCSQEAEHCQIRLSKDPVSAFWRNVVLLFVVVKREQTMKGKLLIYQLIYGQTLTVQVVASEQKNEIIDTRSKHPSKIVWALNYRGGVQSFIM